MEAFFTLFSFIAGAAIGAGIGWFVRSRLFVQPQQVSLDDRPDMLKVGGRLIDRRVWSPEVIEEIRKEYFLPNVAANGHFIRVDLSAGCGQRHNTMVRIGLLTDDPLLSEEVIGAIQKGKAEIKCKDCLKPARIAGRSTVWTGSLKSWDGAT